MNIPLNPFAIPSIFGSPVDMQIEKTETRRVRDDSFDSTDGDDVAVIDSVL